MRSTARLTSVAILVSILLLCSAPLSAALRSKSVPPRVKAHSAAHLSRTARARGRAHGLRSSRPRFRGQQAIQPERTLQIQQALIREHYLSGVPSGEWDQATRNALVRLQRDNHWQTKVLPDARALIKLGLGPSPQNLLNPESAALASVQASAGSQVDSN
jgi:hypothetical protein